jgi:hypothetical protein
VSEQKDQQIAALEKRLALLEQRFAEVLALKRGPKGEKGPRGDPGEQGPRGAVGPRGQTSFSAITGEQQEAAPRKKKMRIVQLDDGSTEVEVTG